MDSIMRGIGIIVRSIVTCPLTRYHVAGILLLLVMQRNGEIEPMETVREIYFKLRYTPTPTKLLTWPIRMALCFLLALPNLPDFPLGLIIYEQHIFPYILAVEIMSCLLLGLHVTNYCSRNASRCYYTDDDPVLQYGDFHSVVVNALIQMLITTHITYSMWLIKSLMLVSQRYTRAIYKWFVRLIMPKLIPACRVVVLMFVFNLQDAVVPVVFIYVMCKIFMDHWLMPLMEEPFRFPNDRSRRYNPRFYHNDDGNASDLSDEFEFEDIQESTENRAPLAN